MSASNIPLKILINPKQNQFQWKFNKAKKKYFVSGNTPGLANKLRV